MSSRAAVPTLITDMEAADLASNKVPYRNPEGYPDPTAYDALNNALSQKTDAEEAEERMNLLIKTLKNTIRLSGFELLNRIEIRDLKTGRYFR